MTRSNLRGYLRSGLILAVSLVLACGADGIADLVLSVLPL